MKSHRCWWTASKHIQGPTEFASFERNHSFARAHHQTQVILFWSVSVFAYRLVLDLLMVAAVVKIIVFIRGTRVMVLEVQIETSARQQGHLATNSIPNLDFYCRRAGLLGQLDDVLAGR